MSKPKSHYLMEGPLDSLLLFGRPIDENEWLYLGKEIEIFDKRYKKTFTLKCYQVKVKDDILNFATDEIEFNHWLFYTIIN